MKLGQCKTPGCPVRLVHARSLCRACHARLTYAVRKGETTWRDLEAAGLCAAPKRVDIVLRKGVR